MAKIKIEYDYQISSMQKYGGISRYYNELINGINLLNLDDLKLINNFQKNYLRVNKFNNFIRFNLLKYYFNFFYNNKANILHKTYYFDNIKKKNSRYQFEVITVFDLIHELNFFELNNNQYKKIIDYKMESINSADHIICISENTKKDLMKYYNYSDEKISVIHLGVSQNFKNNIKYILPKYIPKKFILFVGSRKSYKNSQILIRAFSTLSKQYNDLYLIFFGGQNFDISEKKYFSENNIDSNKVRHLSGSDTLLKSLYDNAEVLVYPSKYEGFGLPPLEAMSCGCPVITTKNGSLNEICGDAAIYFDAENENELLEKISICINDLDIKKQYKKLGLNWSKNFSWEKCCKETVQTYSKLIK